MWISYSDSEVNIYHPICEKALNLALASLHKENEYKVIHHQHTGTLEMDFVIQNILTGKYFCVIEVKRTPSDVHSARYQFQAMSYVQMNASQNEQPFYILTNLERAFSFRYDSSRPRVFQQILDPGLSIIGEFVKDDKNVFLEKLTNFFKNKLQEFFNNDYKYLLTLDEFAQHMEQILTNSKKWKSHLAVLLYEYIRGAFTFINRNELPDVRIFSNNVQRICDEASRINFKDIFSYSDMYYENPTNVENNMLSNLFDFGYQNVSGDVIAGLLHQIVSMGHEHDGEVPTDLELARFVSILSKNLCENLRNYEFVCDPAAGSGNLITAAIETYNLSPNQILVNDINTKLLELLSLRLGLNFVQQINRNNSPIIFNKNVSELDFDFFKNVRAIVMNPPFVAGINCIDRKNTLYRKLNEITNNNYKSNVGQMPLEGVFLELITKLVKPGTIIACVFPKTHLMARGQEAQIIRSLIINNLGLHTIFTYPGDEIFDGVTKDTFVMVGKAMQPADKIKVLSSYDKIVDIDIHKFEQVTKSEIPNDFTNVMPGIIARTISKEELINSISSGWRILNSEMLEGINFVKNNFANSSLFTTLSKSNFNIQRGAAANNGGSDLIFVDSREDLYNQYKGKLVLKPGMRNAKLDSFCINGGDSKFLDIASNSQDIIDNVIYSYLQLAPRTGRQQRAEKTAEQLKSILERESTQTFSANSVLIPRNLRKEGRVYLSEEAVCVSTNFIVCETMSKNLSILLSTWISTIFYQLICEVSSKDQEGTRKMEMSDVLNTFIPQLDEVPTNIIDLLKQEKSNLSFVELKNPVIRNVDKIWAKYLFKENADEMLNKAKRLLSFLANRRNP